MTWTSNEEVHVSVCNERVKGYIHTPRGTTLNKRTVLSSNSCYRIKLFAYIITITCHGGLGL